MHSARHRVQEPAADPDEDPGAAEAGSGCTGGVGLGDARSTWAMDRQAAATFPGAPESVATARRFVRITAAMWQLPRDTLADAELCMSELVCNAVTHTDSSRVHCRLWSARGVLFLEVDDEERNPLPEPSEVDREDEHGRGILLIDAFATAWGAVPRPGQAGKTVWAALHLPADGLVAGLLPPDGCGPSS
jgi:anti-sigma regulatory factor (Ser/Thr protein kinase)